MESPSPDHMDQDNNEDKVIKFKEILQNGIDVGTIIRLGVTIDNVPGCLAIIRTQSNMYNLDFSYTKLCCETTTVIDKYYRTEDELIEAIRKLGTTKLTHQECFQKDEIPRYLAVRDGIYQLLGIPVEACYVCLEDAYGHKTLCNHSICLQCYMKSVNSHTFICGICRFTEECC